MDTRFGILQGIDGSTESPGEREAHERDHDQFIADDQPRTDVTEPLALPLEVDIADALDQLRTIDDLVERDDETA